MSWLLDLIWAVPMYVGVGFLTARHQRHHMENDLKARNDRAENRNNHYNSPCSTSTTYCEYHDVPLGQRSFIDYHGSNWMYPVWAGIGWPVFMVGSGVVRVARVIGKGIKPGWDLFWENPKERKARRALTPVP